MFQKIQVSFKMIGVAFKYIARDPELMFYTILSILFQGVVWGILIALYHLTDFFQYLQAHKDSDLITFLFVLGYYFIFSFVIFFFNAAIITSVQRRMNGENNNFGDGLRDSFKNIGKIAIWSFVTALFSAILNFLQRKLGKDNIIGNVILAIIGGVWRIMAYFSFSLMILENKNVRESLKESSFLFTKTWGERAILISVSAVFSWLIVIFTLGLFAYLYMLVRMDPAGNKNQIIGIILVYIILIALIGILSATVNTIINVILLNYAKNGSLPGILSEEDIARLVSERGGEKSEKNLPLN